MIRLENLSKTYLSCGQPIQALRNIHLQVPRGAIVGVIGQSGAGKSTLIRCVNLLERPTGGRVWVANQELTALMAPDLRAARRQIGMIFQQFNLLASRTVYQNVALPLVLSGLTSSKIQQQVMPLLELTGLKDKAQAYPSQLSGGEKQRTAIARALVSQSNSAQSKVLLCDEATSALDPHTTQSILQLLKDLRQQLDLSILLITHEIEVIKAICDRVALIASGEILEEADIQTFFTQPHSALARAFVQTALGHALSPVLQTRLRPTQTAGSRAVLRLLFWGEAATTPLIDHLTRNMGMTLNILQANIEYIQNMPLGILVAEVIENQTAIPTGIAYLSTQGVKVEVIGYVE